MKTRFTILGISAALLLSVSCGKKPAEAPQNKGTTTPLPAKAPEAPQVKQPLGNWATACVRPAQGNRFEQQFVSITNTEWTFVRTEYQDPACSRLWSSLRLVGTVKVDATLVAGARPFTLTVTNLSRVLHSPGSVEQANKGLAPGQKPWEIEKIRSVASNDDKTSRLVAVGTELFGGYAEQADLLRVGNMTQLECLSLASANTLCKVPQRRYSPFGGLALRLDRQKEVKKEVKATRR